MQSDPRAGNLLRLVAIIAAAILTSMVFGTALAAVTISSFQAQGEAGDVLVTWKTGSEINNVGFNVFRSDSENGSYGKVNKNLIPGCFCAGGVSYQYKDTSAVPGQTYFYRLQSVDTNGGKTMTNCVSVCPVSAAASAGVATPTPTNTTQPTPTKTAKPPTATNTPRPTASKTTTLPPSTPTATNPVPTQALVLDATSTDEPTETDFPTDAPDTTDLGSPDLATAPPTKVAHLATPDNSDQAGSVEASETTTPTPSTAVITIVTPQPGSTSAALRVRQTPVTARQPSAGKPKAAPPSSGRSLGLTESQTTVIAFGVLIFALFGLGVLSGLIALFMWYVKRVY